MAASRHAGASALAADAALATAWGCPESARCIRWQGLRSEGPAPALRTRGLDHDHDRRGQRVLPAACTHRTEPLRGSTVLRYEGP